MVEFAIHGGVVLLDSEDFPLVAGFQWYKSPNGYAVRKDGNTSIFMHCEIFGECEVDVDHRDLNKLNNQRSNLRRATRSQNMSNLSKTKGNTSGFKGVSWAPHANKWRARIRIFGGPYKHLGYFDSPNLAHELYCLAADLVHREFANYG